MANNCLITKLKGVVDNDNLLKVGEMRFGLAESSGSKLNIITTEDVTITVLDGDLTINGGKSYVIPARTWGVANISGSGYVSIDNKYAISSMNGAFSDLSLDDLKFTESFTGLVCVTPSTTFDVKGNDLNLDVFARKAKGITIHNDYVDQLRGNLSLFAGNTDLENIDFRLGDKRAINVYGTMEDLGSMPNVTEYGGIASVTPKMKGSIESFVAAKRSYGKLTGSAVFIWMNTYYGITFDGEIVANVANNSISWTENTITYNGKTINA